MLSSFGAAMAGPINYETAFFLLNLFKVISYLIKDYTVVGRQNRMEKTYTLAMNRLKFIYYKEY